MPPLDPKNPEPYTAGERMESFPPLFENTADQKSEGAANQPAAANGIQPHAVRQRSGGRNFLLLTVIVLVIAAAAAAGVYALLPEFKRADGDPVFYICEGLLYMHRGSRVADTCVVFDLSGQIQSAEEQYGGARQAAGTFFESFYYDEGSETLYFLDFQDSLYCVKINKGFGKKDIQDRVKLISGQVFSPETGDEGPLRTGYSVLPATGQVFFLKQAGQSRKLYVYAGGETRLLSEDAEAYGVSSSGESALFLKKNPAPLDRSEYTMYICSTQSGDLIKVDSKVSSVKKLDDSFDLIWYTRFDPDNNSGPVSVWIGGRTIENELVLSNLKSCGGFSDSGFYYGVQSTQKLNVWDYIADIDPGDSNYGSYSTLRGVLRNSTFERTSQTVSFWSESGSSELARNVASWEVLNAENGLLSMQIYDFSQQEILDIEDVRSAFSAIEFFENTDVFSSSYFSFGGGAAFEGEGLTYCCISPEGNEVWMIDNSGGRGVLYSCTVAEDGFIDRTRIAGDVAAAECWPERNAVLFASDYNHNTKRCDLYVLEEGTVSCISYDVYLPGWEVQLFDGGAAIAYLKDPVFSDDAFEADLYYYFEGESVFVARDVRGFACVSFDRMFYLSAAAKRNPVLYLYNGEHAPAAKDVWAVFAPGVQAGLRLKGS